MVKTLKNLLLRNQKADDFDILYATLGARELPNCSNDDPGLTLSYFVTRLNLVPYAFEWEKGNAMYFLETIVVYDLKLTTEDRSDKQFLLTSKCMPLPRGYIHVLDHEKMYKIRLQRDLFDTFNK